jgi:hypothetical protein
VQYHKKGEDEVWLYYEKLICLIWMKLSHMGHMRNTYIILVRKAEGMRPLGRPMRRWVNNIRMYLREKRWKLWNGFIWFRIVTSDGNTVMNLWVP